MYPEYLDLEAKLCFLPWRTRRSLEQQIPASDWSRCQTRHKRLKRTQEHTAEPLFLRSHLPAITHQIWLLLLLYALNSELRGAFGGFCRRFRSPETIFYKLRKLTIVRPQMVFKLFWLRTLEVRSTPCDRPKSRWPAFD